MAVLCAWRFDSADGADDALATLRALHSLDLVSVRDAAVVRWAVACARPTARHLPDLADHGAPGPAFWDLFVGLTFLDPLLRGDAGPAPEALGAVGIGDDFVGPLREGLGPDASALLVMTPDASAERTLSALLVTGRGPLRADISGEGESALRRAFRDAP